MPGGGGERRRADPVGARRADVGPVLGQQPHPVRHAVRDGPAELAADLVGRGAHGRRQAAAPRAAVAGAEAELQQQLQVLAARLELAVVEGLAVIGVGAGHQQQAGQGQPVRVPGLPLRAALALAERAGQHGERRAQAVPQVAGVRIGARGQQEAGRGQHRIAADVRVVPGVGQVKQRLPPVRAALAPGRAGISGQDPGQLGGVRRRRGGRRAAAGQLRVVAQQLPGLAPLTGTGGLVGDAGQAQELVGPALRARGRVQAPREAAVALHRLDVPAEPGPAGEAVAPGRDQLGGAEREGRRGRAARVMPGDPGQRGRVAGGHGPLQVPGLVTELLEAGLVGQGNGRHRDSFRVPAVRGARPKGGRTASQSRALRQVGSALPADRRPPAGLA